MKKANKKFFFMAGLPRSGGTLLASILSQNPNIYVSPQSCLPPILGATYNQYQSLDHKDSDQFQNIHNVMEAIIPTFYAHQPERYIIDKNFGWLDPHLFAILERHLQNGIKVIYPVRDILGILASWNDLCNKDKNNTYDTEILKKYPDDRNIADKRAQFFSEKNDEDNWIKASTERFQGFINSKHKDSLLLVDYDDLTLSTPETITKIYEFLEIPAFSHVFNGLKTPHEYQDAWGAKGHHMVKSDITRKEYVYSDIFSADTIKKYSGLEFWKQNKGE